MGISYDVFTGEFLAKVTEYEFMRLREEDRNTLTDGYLKRAITQFNKICKYDLLSNMDDENREINVDIDDYDLIEIANILSEGMIVEWLKQHVNKQELLENVLNTRDFTTYSPAELLLRVGNAYVRAQKDYIQMVREYSYNHGDLTTLHL